MERGRIEGPLRPSVAKRLTEEAPKGRCSGFWTEMWAMEWVLMEGE